MSNLSPYFSLPDEWANKARCPVCNSSPLVVVHNAEAPDRMACPRCHCLFEIEENGTRIHFISLPKVLSKLLDGQWVTYAEMKQTVQEVAALQAAKNQASATAADHVPAKTPVPSEPSPFTEEMVTTEIPANSAQPVEEKSWAVVPAAAPPLVFQARAPEIKDVRTRAKDLYALGSRPDQIKAILSRDPLLDKAEIQTEVDNLYGADEAKRRRQHLWLAVGIGAGVIILTLCFVLSTLWQPILSILPGKIGSNFVATVVANKTVSPLMSTPIVIQEKDNGAPRPACPQTKEQASLIFGGPADNWISDSDDGSWFLVVRTPVAVHVPGGMSAVLVSIGSGGVNTVEGPATIENVTSISLLCR